MSQPKPFRETNNLVPFQGQGSWSQWRRAMVPTSSGYTENRGPGQVGYMWSNIRNELNGVVGLCGIYEFQVRGTLPHHLQSAIVYVGSTCRRQADGGQCRRLNNRIINYCRHGNHKADLINDALSRGYELWVRYKQAGSAEQAQAWENTLLAMYNYAWNVRNNGNIRAVLWWHYLIDTEAENGDIQWSHGLNSPLNSKVFFCAKLVVHEKFYSLTYV